MAVGLSDGSSFLVGPDDSAKLGLEIGQSICGERFDVLVQVDENRRAAKKALELLTAREHSEFELRVKLRKRRFGGDAVAHVVSELKDRGYLDDLRFARLWIESRFRKEPRSAAWLRAGLAKAGVSRDVSEQALAETVSDAMEDEALEAAAEKLLRRSKMSREKLVRGLVSRGFAVRDAVRIADRGENGSG